MEQIEAKFAELAAALEEEKLRCRDTEQRLTIVERERQYAKERLVAIESECLHSTQRTQNTPDPPPHPPASQNPPNPTPSVELPKISVPDKFDGTRGAAAETFASQVVLYMMAYPNKFPSDRSKVVFVLSYLTGDASKWAQPLIRELFDETTADRVTYARLYENFSAMYFDSEKRSKAKQAIRLLKQTKSVADYVHEFNIHAGDTGWETPTLISQFRQGLKKDVRIAIVLARTQFDSIEDLTRLAIQIDNEMHGIQETHTRQTHTTKSSRPAPDAMDLSATRAHLTGDERAKRLRQGLCFRCNSHGHISRECPNQIRSGGKGKGRSQVKIAELEERLARTEIRDSDSGSRADQAKNGSAQN